MSETDKTATAIAMANGRTIREVMEDEYRRGYFAGLNARQATDYAYAQHMQEALRKIVDLHHAKGYTSADRRADDMVGIALVALAKNPNPSGHLPTEASFATGEASGPVGLGPNLVEGPKGTNSEGAVTEHIQEEQK